MKRQYIMATKDNLQKRLFKKPKDSLFQKVLSRNMLKNRKILGLIVSYVIKITFKKAA